MEASVSVSWLSQGAGVQAVGVDISELFLLSLASLVLVFLDRVFLLEEKTTLLPDASNIFDFLEDGLFGRPAESKCIITKLRDQSRNDHDLMLNSKNHAQCGAVTISRHQLLSLVLVMNVL